MATLAKSIRRHPWWLLVGVAVLAGVAFASKDVITAALRSGEDISMAVPKAARLTAASAETVYRIDPNDSTATVTVKEKLAGEAQAVELTTQGIAGDLAINADAAEKSRVGDIKINVQQLNSDNSLRDAAIRHSYLDSAHYRFAVLSDASVKGLSGPVSEGKATSFQITGSLTVKDVTKPVTFDAEATLDGDELTATANTTIKMSDFGVGPINKIGLVSTENEAKIALELVARNEDGFEPPAMLVSTADATDDDSGPSFAKTVQPILQKNCVACHQNNNIGTHAFRLETADDAAEVADGLAVVVKARYMPPWPPSSEGIALRHDRSLDQADIDAITAWADAGGRLDVEPKTALKDTGTERLELPEVDQVAKPAEAYAGDGSKKDDYRCQIYDLNLDKPTFIVGYKFIPQEIEVVHHALVYRQTAASRAEVEAMDAADPGPGFSCIGTQAVKGPLVAGWVPGQRPIIMEEGTGQELQPGDFLLSQIHYHYEGERPPDASSLQLDLADPGEERVPLRTRQLIGPVELPCPDGRTDGLCDREAAKRDAAERFGPSGAIIPDILHTLCGTTVEELQANSDGVTAKTVCDFPVREDATVVDVLGHEHEIGRGYRMTLNPDSASEKVLLDIPNWDFAWQLNYQPVDPVDISAGDTIRVECTWDRSLRYDEDPQYILFAEGTEDEMCFSTITTMPRRD